jgi:hypothetical protein
MLGMDYRYADQHVQSPSDKDNARAIAPPDRGRIFPTPAPLPGRLSQDDAEPLWRLSYAYVPRHLLLRFETSRRVARGHLCHAHR